jgi:hypothetical protein
MVSATDSIQRSYRDSVRIPQADPMSVRLVTQEQTCERAAKAYNALWATPEQPRQLYVYKVADRYLVEDPQQGSGEYRGLSVFDAQWNYLATMLTF